MKKVFLYFALIPIWNFAQDHLIWSNDQYSGINGVLISPTHSYLNPNKFDFNLIGENISIHNDYLYISKQSVLGIINTEIETARPENGFTGDKNPNVLDFFNKEKASYYISNDVLGPSFSIKKETKNKIYQFGFFSRLRTQSSAKNLDNYLRFTNSGIDEPYYYQLNPLKTNVMNWAEFGLNFATNIYKTSNQELLIGANVKYAMGLDAAVLESKKTLEIDAIHYPDPENPSRKKTDLYLSDYDIKASYATNYDFDAEKYNFNAQGNGIGIDLGITLLNKNSIDEWYNSKLSFNLLDLGYVNFTGETHEFIGNRVQIQNNPRLDNADINSASDLFHLLSNEVYGDENASLINNKFPIGLPTSLHFGYSKRMNPNQYLHVNWIQRTPIFENSLKRANIINTSYSYENDWFGFGPSLGLHEYKKLQFGGYLRLGPLILGSDNALPFVFKQKKLSSASFYFALKIYPFWDNEQKRRDRGECFCD